MIFSKSFGYAIRAIVFIASRQEPGKFIKVDEIAGELHIPRHFLSKVMKSMSKKEILISSKGPAGGFALNKDTLSMPLLQIALITKDVPQLNVCMLTFGECDAKAPCSLHKRLDLLNRDIMGFLNDITLADLLKEEQTESVKRLDVLNAGNLTKTTAA